MAKVVTITALAGLAAAAVAGTVLDGAGRPAIGFWAVAWFMATVLIVGPAGLLLTSRRAGTRRASKALLGLALAAVSYAAWHFALGTPPISAEGAWLWPLALASLSGAMWFLHAAVFRSR